MLCPIFGWTRGYHDYQFCLPLSAYKNGPPENPAYDALFGTATHPMSFMRNSGFYGTLRSDPSGGRVKSVSDTVVCVADLLQDKGQEIYHVLGGPGWKTVLKVKQIMPREVENDFCLVRYYPVWDLTFQKILYWNLTSDAIKIAEVHKPLSIEFPVEDAKQSLLKAACGQLTPSPEHSTIG